MSELLDKLASLAFVALLPAWMLFLIVACLFAKMRYAILFSWLLAYIPMAVFVSRKHIIAEANRPREELAYVQTCKISENVFAVDDYKKFVRVAKQQGWKWTVWTTCRGTDGKTYNYAIDDLDMYRKFASMEATGVSFVDFDWYRMPNGKLQVLSPEQYETAILSNKKECEWPVPVHMFHLQKTQKRP